MGFPERSYSYTQNGLLHMLDRNRRIKLKPEKFQHCDEKFDLIITCEERVYDQVIECKIFSKTKNIHDVFLFRLIQVPLWPNVYVPVADFNSKSPLDNTPVHIVNVDIQDNQEEATIGAFFICELVQLVIDLKLSIIYVLRSR